MILVYIAAAWMAGIALAAFLSFPSAAWLLLTALPLGYLLIWWRDMDLRRVHIVLLTLVVGALRYQVALPTSSDLALSRFNDQGRVSMIGTIVDEPDRRDAYTDLTIEVAKVQGHGEWVDAKGRALVQAARDTPAQYGDQVQIDGTPTTPPDSAEFSYRDFLARDYIFTTVRYAQVYVISQDHGNPFWATLFRVKASALRAVTTLLPEPSASLLSGILLGNDHGMPGGLRESFNITNTSHIIAISGFNIGLIALYLGVVARRIFAFRPSLADWFVIAALITYTLLVGASASVVRAAIMGVLGVTAVHYRREAFALNSLAAAALLMTILNPYAVWDLGFQLSFLATLGLLLYNEPLRRLLDGFLRRIAGKQHARTLIAPIGDSLIVSVAAWITTTPILVATFHRFSVVGLLTNLFILPAQPPIMVLGGMATITQLVATVIEPVPLAPILLAALAQVLAWGVNIFLQYTINVVQWTAQFPFAAINTPTVDWAIVALFYAVLFLATWLTPRRLADLITTNPAWAVGALACAVVFVSTSAVANPDPGTHIQFIATGGGDSILIRTSKDARILINGSNEPSAVLAHLGQQLPFWDRRLDLVIATHLDESNLASLNAVLERYDVGRVVQPRATETDGASYAKWRELLASEGAAPADAISGTRLQVDEITIEFIYPFADRPSRSNAAVRLTARNHSVILAPSLPSIDTSALAATDVALNSEIAVLPAAFDQDLLRRIDPKTVIMFVGRSSRDKPSQEIQKVIERTKVLRTDEHGTLDVKFHGDEVVVQSQR